VVAAAAPKAPVPAPLPVDTSLAAQMAARMLAARARKQSTPAPAAPSGRESSSFRQLKQSLNRPAQHIISSALGSTFGEHKSNLPIPDKQIAHSQTQSNIGRVNVPRRTAG